MALAGVSIGMCSKSFAESLSKQLSRALCVNHNTIACMPVAVDFASSIRAVESHLDHR